MKGFIYEQSTGTLAVRNGDYECPLVAGFAGREAGRNAPDRQCEKSIGPVPRGDYAMRIVAHPRFKAPAIRLDPSPQTELCGRSGFFIHGGTESHGCVILDKPSRDAVAALVKVGFDTLHVIS